MFGKSITLFKMFGFSVRVDLSWLVIFVLIVWSLAGGVFPQELKGLASPVYLVMGVAGAIGLFLSIVLHELSHSLVARRLGLPIRGITLFIFGGVSEMTDEPASPMVELPMAIVGPLSSIAMAFVSYGIAAGARAAGLSAAAAVFAWLGFINGMLAIFNLVPGFPLDGGRVLRAILWRWKNNFRWATRIAAYVGEAIGTALMILGFVSLLLLNPIGGLWWILIGLFLRSAAVQSYRQAVMREALQGEPVSRFMNADPISVPPNLTVADLVDDYIYRYHFEMFPVVENDRLVGCVTARQVRDVARQDWPQRTVAQIATQCSADTTVAPDADTVKALSMMTRNQTSRLIVVDNGRLVGVVTLKDLLKFLALKLELEGENAPRPGAPSSN